MASMLYIYINMYYALNKYIFKYISMYKYMLKYILQIFNMYSIKYICIFNIYKYVYVFRQTHPDAPAKRILSSHVSCS